MFSMWVECFPSRKADATTVEKALIREIILRWGVPERLSSDIGITELANELRTNFKTHPQNGGILERTNQTVKTKIV